MDCDLAGEGRWFREFQGLWEGLWFRDSSKGFGKDCDFEIVPRVWGKDRDFVIFARVRGRTVISWFLQGFGKDRDFVIFARVQGRTVISWFLQGFREGPWFRDFLWEIVIYFRLCLSTTLNHNITPQTRPRYHEISRDISGARPRRDFHEITASSSKSFLLFL